MEKKWYHDHRLSIKEKNEIRWVLHTLHKSKYHMDSNFNNTKALEKYK